MPPSLGARASRASQPGNSAWEASGVRDFRIDTLMTPAWFILTVLVCNVGAALVFAWQREWPWALIYAGAATIQAAWGLTAWRMRRRVNGE